MAIAIKEIKERNVQLKIVSNGYGRHVGAFEMMIGSPFEANAKCELDFFVTFLAILPFATWKAVEWFSSVENQHKRKCLLFRFSVLRFELLLVAAGMRLLRSRKCSTPSECVSFAVCATVIRASHFSRRKRKDGNSTIGCWAELLSILEIAMLLPFGRWLMCTFRT